MNSYESFKKDLASLIPEDVKTEYKKVSNSIKEEQQKAKAKEIARSKERAAKGLRPGDLSVKQISLVIFGILSFCGLSLLANEFSAQSARPSQGELIRMMNKAAEDSLNGE